MSTVESKPWEVRITQLQPAIEWSLMWGNLQNVRLPDRTRSAWYMVIHIIPTNVKLHRIRLRDPANCTQCGRSDTILHRLKDCGVRQEIRESTRTRISRVQRMDPRRMPKEWLLRPCFKIWPPQRHQTFGFWRMWFFMWWINAGPFRYWTTLTKCVGRGGRYITTKKGRKLWGNICRCSKQAWILEHSTNGTNSKHEKSPLVHITQAYKISSLTPLVVTHLHVHKGPGNRNDSLEWQECWLWLGGNAYYIALALGYWFETIKYI